MRGTVFVVQAERRDRTDVTQFPVEPNGGLAGCSPADRTSRTMAADPGGRGVNSRTTRSCQTIPIRGGVVKEPAIFRAQWLPDCLQG